VIVCDRDVSKLMVGMTLHRIAREAAAARERDALAKQRAEIERANAAKTQVRERVRERVYAVTFV
jgi:hypothetical protein